MSRIKGRDTKPELAVRSILHGMGYRFRLHHANLPGMGYRFRLHHANLPGRPDIVLRKLKTVIFVHGCFWHRHKRCKYAYMPKTQKGFWLAKFVANLNRDAIKKRQLQRLGWKVLTLWECQTWQREPLKARLARLLSVRRVRTPKGS